MRVYIYILGATLLCELAKHTPELAQLIVNSGGISGIVHYITEAEGVNKLPGIMNLGYIAAFGETLAAAVVLAKGVTPLAQALNDKQEHVKAAAAWALGQIGRHSPEHAKMVAEQGVLLRLLQVLTQASDDEIGQDLKMKVKVIGSVLRHACSFDIFSLWALRYSLRLDKAGSEEHTGKNAGFGYAGSTVTTDHSCVYLQVRDCTIRQSAPSRCCCTPGVRDIRRLAAGAGVFIRTEASFKLPQSFAMTHMSQLRGRG